MATVSSSRASLEQRREALARANAVRAMRARELRHLDRARAARLVASPPAWLSSMSLYRLLMRIDRVRESKSAAMLKRVGVGPMRHVGDLTDRERSALVRELRRPLWSARAKG